MKASDVMTRDVVTVAPDTSVGEIAALLLSERISAVPVVDAAGALLGIVSEADLIGRKEAECEERQAWWLTTLAEGEEVNRELLASFNYPRACDLMSAPLITVNEGTSLREIADILTSRGINRLPVVRDGRIVGIISRADLVRALVTHPRPMPV
jgi:CBS domain-containing protein